jgi:hypothetical protein
MLVDETLAQHQSRWLFPSDAAVLARVKLTCGSTALVCSEIVQSVPTTSSDTKSISTTQLFHTLSFLGRRICWLRYWCKVRTRRWHGRLLQGPAPSSSQRAIRADNFSVDR